MNIDLKTEKEIEIMKEGGIRLKKVVKALLKDITVGMTSKHIDDLAENLIEKEGGEPSFKKVKDYFWTTCLPINDQVVHTPPSNRKLNQGDLLSVCILKGIILILQLRFISVKYRIKKQNGS